MSKNKKKKKLKKVSIKQKLEKYIYPSVIFGLMMAGFNYIFLIFSLYSPEYTGIYIKIFDNVVIDVLLNTAFDFIIFAGAFLIDCYLLLEVVAFKNKE